MCALFHFPFPVHWHVEEMGYGLVEPVGTLLSLARKSPTSAPIFPVHAAPLLCRHLIPCAEARAASTSGCLCLKQCHIVPRRWLLSQDGGHTLIGRGEADAQPGNSTGRLGDDFRASPRVSRIHSQSRFFGKIEINSSPTTPNLPALGKIDLNARIHRANLKVEGRGEE